MNKLKKFLQWGLPIGILGGLALMHGVQVLIATVLLVVAMIVFMVLMVWLYG